MQLAGRVDVESVEIAAFVGLDVVDHVVLLPAASGDTPLTSLWSTIAEVDLDYLSVEQTAKTRLSIYT